MQFQPRHTALVTVAVLAVVFSATTVFAAPPQSALSTEKDKVSYAIGMQMAAQMANSLQPVKDDVDPAVIARAINASLTGGKTLMTVPEAKLVLAAFGKKVDARQAAMKAQQATAMAQVGKTNLAAGSAFLIANAKKPGVKSTPSGLQYQVLKAVNGPKPKATDTVKVNYLGQTLDGMKFDSSADHGGPAMIALNAVIPGWTEGLQLMGVGSKYVFWIPGNLAYGPKGAGGPIGPNATLRFEVELLSIGK